MGFFLKGETDMYKAIMTVKHSLILLSLAEGEPMFNINQMKLQGIL